MQTFVQCTVEPGFVNGHPLITDVPFFLSYKTLPLKQGGNEVYGIRGQQ